MDFERISKMFLEDEGLSSAYGRGYGSRCGKIKQLNLVAVKWLVSEEFGAFDVDDEKFEAELKGNTLRVYWFMLKSPSRGVGPREVQRALGFSSPRLAAYHLEKLEKLGLVLKKHGEYWLVQEIKVDVLKQFMRFGSFLFPRCFLYATMFTTFLIYIGVSIREINTYSIFSLVLSILGSAIFWYETIVAWRQKP